MRKFALLILLAVLVACTPGMHRTYQTCMVAAAQAADVHAKLQTRAALREDPTAVESNFMLGDRPSDARLAGAGLFNAGVGALILWLPRDRGPENDWVVDVIATGWMMVTVYWAVNDTVLTDARWYH